MFGFTRRDSGTLPVIKLSVEEYLNSRNITAAIMIDWARVCFLYLSLEGLWAWGGGRGHAIFLYV